MTEPTVKSRKNSGRPILVCTEDEKGSNLTGSLIIAINSNASDFACGLKTRSLVLVPVFRRLQCRCFTLYMNHHRKKLSLEDQLNDISGPTLSIAGVVLNSEICKVPALVLRIVAN
jgi:hypothetical protein